MHQEDAEDRMASKDDERIRYCELVGLLGTRDLSEERSWMSQKCIATRTGQRFTRRWGPQPSCCTSRRVASPEIGTLAGSSIQHPRTKGKYANEVTEHASTNGEPASDRALEYASYLNRQVGTNTAFTR